MNTSELAGMPRIGDSAPSFTVGVRGLPDR